MYVYVLSPVAGVTVPVQFNAVVDIAPSIVLPGVAAQSAFKPVVAADELEYCPLTPGLSVQQA